VFHLLERSVTRDFLVRGQSDPITPGGGKRRGAKSLDRVGQMPVSHMILSPWRASGGSDHRSRGLGHADHFPTLVGSGVPPVTATNCPMRSAWCRRGCRETWANRRELRGGSNGTGCAGDSPRSLIGAGPGVVLLLHLPERVFENVGATVLLVLALGLVLVSSAHDPGVCATTAEQSGQSPNTMADAGWRRLVVGTS